VIFASISYRYRAEIVVLYLKRSVAAINSLFHPRGIIMQMAVSHLMIPLG
jgi:hypothetical protein